MYRFQYFKYYNLLIGKVKRIFATPLKSYN